jgi:thiol:disulfide interchange protein DsbG
MLLRLLIPILLPATASAASPPLCAPPAPAATEAADTRPALPSTERPAPSALSQTTKQAAAAPIPAALAELPFIKHVAAAGSTITDLGPSHGLHAVAARNGDQFMLFDVTPDGQAAVSGAPIEITPAEIQSVAAGNVINLDRQHGLQGFFVRSGTRFQVFYATPDQQRLVPGVLWDTSGKDLTRAQVAAIPGAIPTVEVASGTTGDQARGETPALPLMRRASYGTIGPVSAPHLFMLIDPQCVYSIRSFQMLMPYVASNRLQLSVIPLSVLDYEDRGQSTKSALSLLSKPADQIVTAWQAGNEGGPPAPDAEDRLRANMAIAEAVGLKGTPTFIWRKSDGTEGRLDGVPTDIATMIASIGN